MKTILREDESGVSEVIGTILILAMTVVLFSVIIIWVSNIPTPTAQTRLDIRPEMQPIYSGLGVEIGVNITLFHQGGEALLPVPTIIYVVSQRGSAAPQTDVVILHLYNGLLATPSGLMDGKDSVWDIGERWAYKNYLLRSSDTISVTIIDIQKSFIVWTSQVTAPAGTRPPVFTDKWTDGFPSTEIVDPVQATLGFNLYVKVTDPDNDLNVNSVYATLTMWYGVNPTCSVPLPMKDDGVAPDRAAGDHVFTLGSSCMSSPLPPLEWDGSIILLNATDLKGHQTTTRFVLHVVPQTFGGGGGGGSIPSQLWQYIGFIQVRAEEVWFSHMGEIVGTSNHFSLGRVQRNDLNTGGGALFHLLMANHGNRTIFVDGFTSLAFRSASASSVQTIYVVCGVAKDPAGNSKCAVDPTKPANAGGLAKYPGTGVYNNFEYAQVFDINPLNQETGGTPVAILAVTRTAFTCCTTTTWGSDSFFPSILVSGISGPLNMTYQQIISRWGANYNPFDHLNDVDLSMKTQWYAQVIPFIAMTVI
ncbi:MAG TPA: type IV pilin N-terminal domain-containing protein [Thermoplasmata archaeon]